MKLGPIHAWVNRVEKRVPRHRGEYDQTGQGFLFRGDVFYRYDWAADAAARGYPQQLAQWKLPGLFGKGIDAALSGVWAHDGWGVAYPAGDSAKLYLFKGTQYVTFSWRDNAPTGDSPRSIGDWGLPAPFAGGIDAAVNGEGPMAGKSLFIKGSQYIVFDWAKDAVEGKPTPLHKLGFKGAFAIGVDAATEGVGQYGGNAYFFRGDKYIRYEWATGTIDKRYPQPIAGNWMRLGETLALDPFQSSFFNTWIGLARDSQKQHQIPWEVTLAQLAVETGWARSAPGNNAFGVKAGSGWNGSKSLRRTREVHATADHKYPTIYSITEKQDGNPPRKVYEYIVDDWFRNYASMEDSFRDRAAVLQQDNFRGTRGIKDPFEFARAVAKAGYATDPNYFAALSSVIRLLQRIQKVVE